MDVEELAAKEGWAPKDQWRGNPDDWKSAEEFLGTGKKIVEGLKGKVSHLDQRVNELLETNKKFAEFSEKAIQKEKQEKERVIAELEQIRKTAITEGDGDAFDKADKQIKQLEKEETPSNGGEKLDPMAEKWLNDNKWYNEDTELQLLADDISANVVRQGFTGQAYFDELTRRVKKLAPEKFENPNRKKAAAVDEGQESKEGGKTWSDLPADAKKAYAEFARDMPGYTKEQYLASYEWE